MNQNRWTPMFSLRSLRPQRNSAQRGFTLIELLIVVAIIGIIASILIPSLLDALQKANQKRTVADMRNLGTAWMSWLTDQVSGAAAGNNTAPVYNWNSFTTQDLPYNDLVGMLRPSATFYYMQQVPQYDGWKHAFKYGFAGPSKLLSHQVMGIYSGGRDGTDATSPDATYPTGAFMATDYNQDIIWADGFFVRWPGGLNQGS